MADTESLSRVIMVRVSPSKLTEFKKRSRAAGFRTIAEWARESMDHSTVRRVTVTAPEAAA